MTYEESLKQRRLTGSRCRGCGAKYLPPRPICPHCHSKDMEPVEFKGNGKLVAFTVICVPPPAMAKEGYSREKPYCCGVVELEEGVRITARILGLDVMKPDTIKIGTPVLVEFASRPDDGEDGFILAFRVIR